MAEVDKRVSGKRGAGVTERARARAYMMKQTAIVSDDHERKTLERLEGIRECVQDADTCRADSHWQS